MRKVYLWHWNNCNKLVKDDSALAHKSLKIDLMKKENTNMRIFKMI